MLFDTDLTVTISEGAKQFSSGAAIRSFEGSKGGDLKELNGIRFRWCPSGSFTMGSPKKELGRLDNEDQVNVRLSTGFWLAETELTQGQWQKLMRTTPWLGQNYVKEGSNYPATYISHDDAVSYCQRLTKQERSGNRLPEGWKYSLPTEAQWEYACRAGTKTKYWFGDDESQLSEFAWFDKNASNIGEQYAHEVGKKKANPWGLQDMHGNVWEWCSDWYGSELLGGRDPVEAGPGPFRGDRGGSWGSDAACSRSAYRDGDSPNVRSSLLGFRLALVPE